MQKYVSILEHPLNKELFNEPKNEEIKPIGGLWACKLMEFGDTRYKSNWDVYIDDILLRDTNGYFYNYFTISENAKVYRCEIWTEALKFVEKYSYPFEGTRLYILDVEKLKKDGYDAFYISQSVADKGHVFHYILNDHDQYDYIARTMFYPYDVDSLFVLNYDIIENIETEKIIRKED